MSKSVQKKTERANDAYPFDDGKREGREFDGKGPARPANLTAASGPAILTAASGGKAGKLTERAENLTERARRGLPI